MKDKNSLYYCQLTERIFKDPVIDREGNTYERRAILRWLTKNANRSPFTNQSLKPEDLIPNRRAKDLVQQFLEENPSYQKDVYQENEILEMIETAIIKKISSETFVKQLLEIMTENPSQVQEIISDDIKDYLKLAYVQEPPQIGIFLAIYKNFENILPIKEAAVTLLSKECGKGKFEYDAPNVMWFCENLTAQELELIINILGKEKCLALIEDLPARWSIEQRYRVFMPAGRFSVGHDRRGYRSALFSALFDKEKYEHIALLLNLYSKDELLEFLNWYKEFDNTDYSDCEDYKINESHPGHEDIPSFIHFLISWGGDATLSQFITIWDENTAKEKLHKRYGTGASVLKQAVIKLCPKQLESLLPYFSREEKEELLTNTYTGSSYSNSNYLKQVSLIYHLSMAMINLQMTAQCVLLLKIILQISGDMQAQALKNALLCKADISATQMTPVYEFIHHCNDKTDISATQATALYYIVRRCNDVELLKKLHTLMPEEVKKAITTEKEESRLKESKTELKDKIGAEDNIFDAAVKYKWSAEYMELLCEIMGKEAVIAMLDAPTSGEELRIQGKSNPVFLEVFETAQLSGKPVRALEMLLMTSESQLLKCLSKKFPNEIIAQLLDFGVMTQPSTIMLNIIEFACTYGSPATIRWVLNCLTDEQVRVNAVDKVMLSIAIKKNKKIPSGNRDTVFKFICARAPDYSSLLVEFSQGDLKDLEERRNEQKFAPLKQIESALALKAVFGFLSSKKMDMQFINLIVYFKNIDDIGEACFFYLRSHNEKISAGNKLLTILAQCSLSQAKVLLNVLGYEIIESLLDINFSNNLFQTHHLIKNNNLEILEDLMGRLTKDVQDTLVRRLAFFWYTNDNLYLLLQHGEWLNQYLSHIVESTETFYKKLFAQPYKLSLSTHRPFAGAFDYLSASGTLAQLTIFLKLLGSQTIPGCNLKDESGNLIKACDHTALDLVCRQYLDNPQQQHFTTIKMLIDPLDKDQVINYLTEDLITKINSSKELKILFEEKLGGSLEKFSAKFQSDSAQDGKTYSTADLLTTHSGVYSPLPQEPQFEIVGKGSHFPRNQSNAEL